MSAGEIAIVAMHKRMFSKSGGREPAVVPETAPAMAIGFRGVITFTTHDRMAHDGWLTPAAPGARPRFAEK
jgi:hypothetical protein